MEDTTYVWPISQTNDLMALAYVCFGHDECWGCIFEDLCWTGYDILGYLLAKEVQKHYFTMIYSEGE